MNLPKFFMGNRVPCEIGDVAAADADNENFAEVHLGRSTGTHFAIPSWGANESGVDHGVVDESRWFDEFAEQSAEQPVSDEDSATPRRGETSSFPVYLGVR
jgi:hypothetical protein